MALLRDVVVDCHHPASLARWWAATPDGYRVAPYDAAELARLRAAGIGDPRAAGIEDPEDNPSVLDGPESGAGVRIFFSAVPEPKSGKNRVHLDVTARDLGAEVAGLVSGGASVLAHREGWVVLADPEGNGFCVFPGGEPPAHGAVAARQGTTEHF